MPEQELDARAEELLRAAVAKRLENRETVVLGADGLGAQEREPFLRMAAALKRPRHLILLETAREQVREEDHAALNELRRALDAGELGAEGIQTVLRLGGGTAERGQADPVPPAPPRRILARPGEPDRISVGLAGFQLCALAADTARVRNSYPAVPARAAVPPVRSRASRATRRRLRPRRLVESPRAERDLIDPRLVRAELLGCADRDLARRSRARVTMRSTIAGDA